MNSKNHYNFKICNNNTCVKNENVSKFNKKLNESICIPHGVKTNPTNNQLLCIKNFITNNSD